MVSECFGKILFFITILLVGIKFQTYYCNNAGIKQKVIIGISFLINDLCRTAGWK